MMNKKLLTAAVAATLMSGVGYSQAEDEFAISGNIALTRTTASAVSHRPMSRRHPGRF